MHSTLRSWSIFWFKQFSGVYMHCSYNIAIYMLMSIFCKIQRRTLLVVVWHTVRGRVPCFGSFLEKTQSHPRKRTLCFMLLCCRGLKLATDMLVHASARLCVANCRKCWKKPWKLSAVGIFVMTRVFTCLNNESKINILLMWLLLTSNTTLFWSRWGWTAVYVAASYWEYDGDWINIRICIMCM